MADWREGLVTFRVQGERHTGGSVDLPHDTEVAAEPKNPDLRGGGASQRTAATQGQRSSAIRGSARR
jgi:hypothetical protein